mgnify:CR=1 FL=1
MQSIDDKAYKKYFSMRRENSKWSEKNKALVKSLEERGLMTAHGRNKIEEAQKNESAKRFLFITPCMPRALPLC